MQDFKNMKQKVATMTPNRNHSCMTAKDLPLRERLTHEKIMQNFEHFASRESFKSMDPVLKNLFYEGAPHIINNAMIQEEESL